MSEQGSGRTKPKKKRFSIIRFIFSLIGTVLFLAFTLVLIGVCASAMGAKIFMKYVETSVTPTVQVNAGDYTLKLSSVIYTHDDEVEENDGWVEYQTIYGVENRIYVDFDQIPDALWQAAVSIEDERFFEHQGVDWKRTGGAVLKLFSGDGSYGGSTITQQMLKNMTGDNKPYINRKLREIFRALEFEKNYTKWEILELYLNMIALGKGCYGVQTAAEYYFGKEVSELTPAECASLIAITNNPSMYGPMSTVVITNPETGVKKTAREMNKSRQETILWKMWQLGYITESQYRAYIKEPLNFTDGTTSVEDLAAAAAGSERRINSWFVDQVCQDVVNDLAQSMDISQDAAWTLLYNGGYHIYTTLDTKLQAIAESVYEDRSNLDVTSAKGQKLQSGITVIDPYTGNIVAMVGAIGPKEGNRLWNFATGKRQVGSSMKPLTAYAPALDAGTVTPATSFDNYPVQVLNGSPWPKNSPNSYTGFTTIQEGVRRSINTIAVQSLESLGVTGAYSFATEKLNLSLVPEDMNLSSLGMGGLTYGLNTVEMAAAYACFPNQGIYNAPRMYEQVTDANGNVILSNEGKSHVAMKESTAYFMTGMLQEAVNSGTGNAAKFNGMAIAGKTGTTNNNFDRYFVGFTPYYCAAVWTGYEYNERISYSGNPAITMWKKVMQRIHEDLPNTSFSGPPSGLESVSVCMDSGLRPTAACSADIRGSRVRTVSVAAGTAPTESCNLHVLRPFCTEGNCLAGEFCPEESVVEKGCLDYVREDYGPGIYASDSGYLLVNLMRAQEEGGGCSVHSTAQPEEPETPIIPIDPEGPVVPWEPPAQTTPQEPVTPPPPSTPLNPEEPMGSHGDNEWWSDFWEDRGK